MIMMRILQKIQKATFNPQCTGQRFVRGAKGARGRLAHDGADRIYILYPEASVIECLPIF